MVTQKNVTGLYGNPDYIAPEVMYEQKYYHIKTDVYSLGRLMCHLFFYPNCLKIEDKNDGQINLEI
jgi:serine/threonine protein kinase